MHDLQRTEISLSERIESVLAVAWDGSMNGLAYAVLAVIQRLVRMSLATTVRMETAINVSMHEN